MIPAYSFVPDKDRTASPVLTRERPYVHTAFDGTVTLYLDVKEFDFHMDVTPCALPSVVMAFEDTARRMGFMTMDEDECPAELHDGFVRIYMVPIEPVTDVAFEMPTLANPGFGSFSMEIPAMDVDDDEDLDTASWMALRNDVEYVEPPVAPDDQFQYRSKHTNIKRRGRHRR